jgi:hypothetical protein
MPVIVTPAIRKIYKDLIKQVVEDLHKPILVFSPPGKEDCPNCVYDFVNKTSSGNFQTSFVAPVVIFGNTIDPASFTRGRCPVCYGDGHIENEIKRNVKALVKWNPGSADDLESLPVGREGKSVVRIKVLRADFDLINDAISFTVDGVRCEMIKPPTIRGLGTQEELVIAFLQEVEPGKDVKK